MFGRRILVDAQRARSHFVFLFEGTIRLDRAHEAAATPLVPTDHVGHAVVLRAVLHEFFHLGTMIEGVRRANDFGAGIHLADQIVSLLPESRIEVDVRFPGIVRFVPDFVAVKILVIRFELVVDDGLYFIFPVVHVLELVRPARQYVGQADLDFGADALDARSYEESSTDTLLATAAATRRRKEHIRLERSDILLDIARKRFGKPIEGTCGHVGHRLDAIAQTHVQVDCRKKARRQQDKRKYRTKIHKTIPCGKFNYTF